MHNVDAEGKGWIGVKGFKDLILGIRQDGFNSIFIPLYLTLVMWRFIYLALPEP